MLKTKNVLSFLRLAHRLIYPVFTPTTTHLGGSSRKGTSVGIFKSQPISDARIAEVGTKYFPTPDIHIFNFWRRGNGDFSRHRTTQGNVR